MVNKNRIVLSSLVVLLIILGVIYFVSGSFTAAPVSNYTTNDTNTGWTTAGGSDTFNMTLVWVAPVTLGNDNLTNITSINITLPPLFNASTLTVNTSLGFIAPNGSVARPTYAFVNHWKFNYTSDIGGGTTLINKTIRIYTQNITYENETSFGNATVYLWFYFTASSTVANETNATVTVQFMDKTNQSNNHQITFQHGIDGAAPRLGHLNVTDGVNTNSTGFNHTSDTNISWMKLNTSMNISVDLVVEDANADTAIMCYSSNVSTNVSELCRTTQVGSTNATMTRASLNGTSAVYTYRWNSDNFTNATQTMSFIFFVNDTFGHTRWLNNSEGMYKFKTDSDTPSSSITISDEDKIIRTSNSITLTCSGSDSFSGVLSYSLIVTKPNTETVTYTDSDDHVFTDTGLPGTYEIECRVTDRAGTSSTATDSFLVLYSSVSAGDGGGGGTTFSVDADFSKEGVTEKYFTKGEGSIVDFSLDGSTKHTIEFTKITEKAITLTIASTPQVITLMTGEIKEVDVDGNNINDITLKLESIANGAARVRVSSVTEGVEAAKAGAGKEEKKEETPPGTPTTPPTETGPGTIPKAPNGKTGLIIAIAIIVIGVVIYFVAFRKKK